MSVYGGGLTALPGFDAVLRDHKRLAQKLTSDEQRAVRDYIDDRVGHEQAEVNFRLYALRNDYDVMVRRTSKTISDLYEELNEKKEIIKHYQSSDKNISAIQKQKEERWEKKQELMMTEIEKLEGEATRAKTRLAQTESDLEAKDKTVQDLETRLEEANKSVALVDEANRKLKECEETKAEVLKLKMDLDKKDRQMDGQNKMMDVMRKDVDKYERDRKYAETRVNAMQDELRKQVSEVAAKCEDLSKLQFQLQMEKRQAETLQRQLKHATDDVNNYKRMIEAARPPLSPRDPIAITLRKDLDIMDIRIRSLDIAVRLRMDEIQKVEDRVDDLKSDDRLISQIKQEIYHRGDSYLELTVAEMTKRIDFRQRRLLEELKYARDWEQPRRDADMLRGEITALMKQAAICKVSELGDRAAKQLQKIDLIMRGTSDTVKMPKIYKVSDRSNADYRKAQKKPRHISGGGGGAHKSAFITSSTPINGFETSSRMTSPHTRNRRHAGVTRGRNIRPALDNYTDDTKMQYVDTVELDLTGMTSLSTDRRDNQSDRMTLKSISTVPPPAISE